MNQIAIKIILIPFASMQMTATIFHRNAHARFMFICPCFCPADTRIMGYLARFFSCDFCSYREAVFYHLKLKEYCLNTTYLLKKK